MEFNQIWIPTEDICDGIDGSDGREQYKVNIAGETESVLDRRWTVLSAVSRAPREHCHTVTPTSLHYYNVVLSIKQKDTVLFFWGPAN